MVRGTTYDNYDLIKSPAHVSPSSCTGEDVTGEEVWVLSTRGAVHSLA
jgi:hypothetical protein